MPDPIAFVQPVSLDEAVECLSADGDEAKIVAGATALTIMLRQRLVRPTALLSLAGLSELSGIDRTDGHVQIGALTTHRAVELSPLVRDTMPVLAHTFGVVANVRVRNAATVGGVLADADYASDPPPVFLALDAEVHVLGPRRARAIPSREFVKGFYETALESDEILTGVSVPIPDKRSRGVYNKYVTRSTEYRARVLAWSPSCE